MPKLPPIRPVLIFEAAARLGSFKKAADEFNVTPSAVSHNISVLEAYLGLRLFVRKTRSVSLTNEGYKFATLIGQVTHNIEWATREIMQTREVETLTIQAFPTFATTWLAPRLLRFCEMNSDMDIRLKTTLSPTSALEEGVDLAVTYMGTAAPGHVEIPLFSETIQPFANPTYWASLPGRDDSSKLAKATLIHSDRSLIGWKAWLDQATLTHPAVSRGPCLDRGHMALDMAAGGWGVALESSVFAQRLIDAGRLISLFSEQAADTFDRSHKIVMREGYQHIPKIRRFIDEINQEMGGSD